METHVLNINRCNTFTPAGLQIGKGETDLELLFVGLLVGNDSKVSVSASLPHIPF